MTLDATTTLALLREMRSYHERGQRADAQLVFEALRPSLAQLARQDTWHGDEPQTYEAFGLLAWLSSEGDPKPYGVSMPEWLSTWVVTTHRDLVVPARARFAGRPAGSPPPDPGTGPTADPPRAHERDPIELAVLGVILSGASLLLALETKIKARQAADSKAAAERAAAGNRVRLRAIQAHMEELRRHLGSVRELGRLELDPARPELTRTSIVFPSAEAEEQFNQNFERITAMIGRLNRLMSEIDVRGLSLSDGDIRKFVQGPIAVAEARLGALLRPGVGPHERSDRVAELLADYAALSGNLAAALDTGP
jgi:hypothetical protein